jgi:prevent-host-death family protein
MVKRVPEAEGGVAAKPKKAARQQTSRRSRVGTRISATEFKAQCLALMDRVGKTGEEIVITKHGKPVAKLIAIREQPRESAWGSMKGTVQILGDIVAPDFADWDVDDND